MDLRKMWKRPEFRFLVLFVVILSVAFTVVAFRPVNDSFVVPYTTLVARVSGSVLGWMGEEITVRGCDLSSPRFAVKIYNGCNGLITTLIFVAGVLAFPARWPAKLWGVLGGIVAIQAINLVRIVSLYYIGVFLPKFFNQSHIFVWQSIVILFGVGLWVTWAHRFGGVDEARS